MASMSQIGVVISEIFEEHQVVMKETSDMKERGQKWPLLPSFTFPEKTSTP